MAKTRLYKRDPPQISQIWNGKWVGKPPSTVYSSADEYLEGNLTVSQGNPGYRSLSRQSGAVGGNFRVVKKKWSASSPLGGDEPTHFSANVNPLADVSSGHYYGHLRAVSHGLLNSSSFWPSVSASSDSQLDALGTTAIARTIPTSPVADLVTTFGELLREGIPSMIGAQTWRERSLKAKNAGSEYLNVEFGWKPLINEIQTFARVVRDADRILKQYEKMSGQKIMRSYQFPTETSSTLTELGNAYPIPASIATIVGAISKQGNKQRFDKIETRRWFEACYTFYLPKSGTLDGFLARADKLYGLRITPEVLWNLAPWSWAIDWFSNAGDVMKNISRFAADGLVMRYGYVMEHKKHERTFTLSNVGFKSYGDGHTFVEIFEVETKSRRVANPYGFASNWSGLTLRQKAIIAALGLTRSR